MEQEKTEEEEEHLLSTELLNNIKEEDESDEYETVSSHIENQIDAKEEILHPFHFASIKTESQDVEDGFKNESYGYNIDFDIKDEIEFPMDVSTNFKTELEMAQYRKRTTGKAKWTAEALKEAISAVNKGSSVRSTAVKFNIPRTTLRDLLKSNTTEKPKLGRKPVFTAELEKEILLLSKLFYGFSVIELRHLAYELAEANGVPHTFNKASKLAGLDWVYGFLKRNPQIIVRKSEATCLNRIGAFSQAEVDVFYRNIGQLQRKHKFSGSRIYNVDETGISTVQRPGEILGSRDQKQADGATSWERGNNVTVVCAMSASGNYIPPMFIYPRQRLTPLLQKGGPTDAIYACSKNGWINEELFMNWLVHFRKHTHPTKEDPVLLILDNHSSHKSYSIYNFCRTNFIHIVSLPPHSSHRLLPLNVSFYGPLKSAFNKECELFVKYSEEAKITPYEVAEIFNRAYIRVANIEKAVKGFLVTGIHPLNSSKFGEDSFVAASETQEIETVKEEDQEKQQNDKPQNPSDASHMDSQTTKGKSRMSAASETKSPTSSQLIHPSSSFPLKEISSIPSCSKMDKSRAKKRQHSESITSSTLKKHLKTARKIKVSIKRENYARKRPKVRSKLVQGE